MKERVKESKRALSRTSLWSNECGCKGKIKREDGEGEGKHRTKELTKSVVSDNVGNIFEQKLIENRESLFSVFGACFLFLL
jgi:hypothetical protein